MDVEPLLKEYAAADAIAEEIICDKQQVNTAARACKLSRGGDFERASTYTTTVLLWLANRRTSLVCMVGVVVM